MLGTGRSGVNENDTTMDTATPKFTDFVNFRRLHPAGSEGVRRRSANCSICRRKMSLNLSDTLHGSIERMFRRAGIRREKSCVIFAATEWSERVPGGVAPAAISGFSWRSFAITTGRLVVGRP
jgi:hypothetical protein